MSDELALRVRVQDVWDEVRIEASGSTPVGDVKDRALRASRVLREPSSYVVKFRGAEVADDATLDAVGIVPNANLIVLPRRRRPVR